MEEITVMSTLDDRLLVGAKRAIRNINRCLYTWIQDKKAAKKADSIVLDITDVNGLVKNWFKREINPLTNSRTNIDIFRYGKFFTRLDDDGNIKSLGMNSLDNWCRSTAHEKLKRCLETIDYSLLKFNPDDYKFIGEDGYMGFDPTFFIDRTHLENFSFTT